MFKLLLIPACGFLFFACASDSRKEKIKPAVPDTSSIVKTTRDASTWTPVDVSPMDMSYFPVDYPKLHQDSVKKVPLARVIYSRPQLQGRKLFDRILKYGEPWRLGANEATELELYKPARIQGKLVNPGRYVLYCIPQKDSWTVVLNANIDSWGLHRDTTKDIARFIIPVRYTGDSIEFFTMLFRNELRGAAGLYMAWDNVEAVLPIEFN